MVQTGKKNPKPTGFLFGIGVEEHSPFRICHFETNLFPTSDTDSGPSHVSESQARADVFLYLIYSFPSSQVQVGILVCGNTLETVASRLPATQWEE